MSSTAQTADMTEIKVMLGRMDERMAGMQRDAEARERVADARHAENRAALALYVPRPEIESMHKVLSDRVSAIEDSAASKDELERVQKAIGGLEGFRGQILRYALMLSGAVIAGVAAIGKLAGAQLPSLLP